MSTVYYMAMKHKDEYRLRNLSLSTMYKVFGNHGIDSADLCGIQSCHNGMPTCLSKCDFTIFEFEGRQDVGTWEIEGGTDDYAGLSGSGDVTLDWDAEEVIYIGEAQTG